MTDLMFNVRTNTFQTNGSIDSVIDPDWNLNNNNISNWFTTKPIKPKIKPTKLQLKNQLFMLHMDESVKEAAKERTGPVIDMKKMKLREILEDIEKLKKIRGDDDYIIADFFNTSSSNFFNFIEQEEVIPIFNEVEKRLINTFNSITEKIDNVKKLVIKENEKNKDKKNIKEDIEKQFFEINNIFPYDTEKRGWKLPVYELTDKSGNKRNFPDLYLSFGYKHQQARIGIKIRLGPKPYFAKNTDYPHPHVGSGGEVCLGDLEGAAQLLWEKKQFVALAFMLNDLFATYNPESPYVILEKWDGQEYTRCANCGSEVIIGEEVSYEDKPYCSECVRWSSYYRCTILPSETEYSELLKSYIYRDDAKIVYDRTYGKTLLPQKIIDASYKKCLACERIVNLNEFRKDNDIICKYCL